MTEFFFFSVYVLQFERQTSVTNKKKKLFYVKIITKIITVFPFLQLFDFVYAVFNFLNTAVFISIEFKFLDCSFCVFKFF